MHRSAHVPCPPNLTRATNLPVALSCSAQTWVEVTSLGYHCLDGTERNHLTRHLRLVAHRAKWYALARKRPGEERRAFAPGNPWPIFVPYRRSSGASGLI